jgi:hypothetical protein
MTAPTGRTALARGSKTVTPTRRLWVATASAGSRFDALKRTAVSLRRLSVLVPVLLGVAACASGEASETSSKSPSPGEATNEQSFSDDEGGSQVLTVRQGSLELRFEVQEMRQQPDAMPTLCEPTGEPVNYLAWVVKGSVTASGSVPPYEFALTPSAMWLDGLNFGLGVGDPALFSERFGPEVAGFSVRTNWEGGQYGSCGSGESEYVPIAAGETRRFEAIANIGSKDAEGLLDFWDMDIGVGFGASIEDDAVCEGVILLRLAEATLRCEPE